MKLCWDSLEGMYLTRNGFFRKGTNSYIFKDACINCGMPFLAERKTKEGKESTTKFCCNSCSKTGKKHSEESKRKISAYNTGRIGAMLGKKHSEESKRKISICNIGDKNTFYKGGVKHLQIPLYDTYYQQLIVFEEVRIYMLRIGCVVYKTLQVRCNESSCKKWFRPTIVQVTDRLMVFSGFSAGQYNFYCSNTCKGLCSTFRKIKYSRGFKTYKGNSRPGQPQWRKMVLERDNYTCQICGFYSPDGKGLIGHHIEPVIRNPIESMDIDVGITLCESCDKMVHRLPGCSPAELRCKK